MSSHRSWEWRSGGTRSPRRGMSGDRYRGRSQRKDRPRQGGYCTVRWIGTAVAVLSQVTGQLSTGALGGGGLELPGCAKGKGGSRPDRNCASASIQAPYAQRSGNSPYRDTCVVDRYCFGVSRNTEDGRFCAIAHPARRAILVYLRDHGRARAGDLARDLKIVPSTLSGHLRILRDADLIVPSRRGTEIWYRTKFTVLGDLIFSAAKLLGDRHHK